MHKNLNFATDSAVIILSVILGFISVVLPPYVIPDGIQVKCDAPLFPMIATASANFAFLPTVLLLLFSGIMLGVIRPNFWFVF